MIDPNQMNVSGREPLCRLCGLLGRVPREGEFLVGVAGKVRRGDDPVIHDDGQPICLWLHEILVLLQLEPPGRGQGDEDAGWVLLIDEGFCDVVSGDDEIFRIRIVHGQSGFRERIIFCARIMGKRGVGYDPVDFGFIGK